MPPHFQSMKLQTQDWYSIIIEILKTKKFPDNFLEIRQSLIISFKEEVNNRIANILNTPKFDRRIQSTKNRHFREAVIKRDRYICFDCKNKITNGFDVAHILPVDLFPEFAYEVWNGQVKCRECHKKDNHPSVRYAMQNAKKNSEKLEELNESLNRIEN